MNEVNVVVIDKVYSEEGEKIRKQCSAINDTIVGYKQCLVNIADNAIVSGSVNEALRVYISYVCSLIDVASDLGSKYESICRKFISDIDEADDYLYEGENQERYFTEEEQKAMFEMLDKPLCKVTDGVGDWIIQAITNICDFFNIKEIFGISTDLQKNKRLLLDLKDTTKETLNDIYTDVKNVDRKYGNSIGGAGGSGDYYTSKFDYVSITLALLRDTLTEMKYIISPENGKFTAEEINTRLAPLVSELHSYLDETLLIDNEVLTEEIAEIFVSNPQNETWFYEFRGPINDEIAELSNWDLANMVIFQGTTVSTSMLADRFSVPSSVATEDVYAYLQIKKQLSKTIGKMAENEDFSDYTENLDKAQKIIDAITKHKEDYPGYEKYKKMYDSVVGNIMGTVGNSLDVGMDLIEIIMTRFFCSYLKNQEIIESLSNGVDENSLLGIAINDLRADYNNKFLATAKDFAGYISSELIEKGIKKGTKELLKIAGKGASSLYTILDTAKNVAGELSGLGGKATATLDFVSLSQSLNDYQGAYQYNFQKVASGDYTESDLTNLKNSFELLKNAYVKCYQLLAQRAEASGDGMKQSYYLYLSKLISKLKISKDAEAFNFVSYDDYVKLHS